MELQNTVNSDIRLKMQLTMKFITNATTNKIVKFTEKCLHMLYNILATQLANYEDDSLDGDSFVSQSRFDAYAIRCIIRAIF